MRRSLLLIAFLAAGSALASVQRSNTPAIDSVRPAIDSGSRGELARFPFNSPGCYATGSKMGTKGEILTVTRAGTRTCNVAALGAAPQIVTCQANEACVEAGGLLVEPGRTNALLRSEDFATSWIKGASGAAQVAIAASTELGPRGVAAQQLTFPALTGAANTFSVLYQSFSATTATWTFSVYLRAVTGAATVQLSLSNGTTAAQAPCTVGTTWSRCTVSHTGAATATVQIGPDCRANTPQASCTQAAAVVYATGAQVEAGAYASSFVPTVSTSAARAADVITVANPLAGINPSAWCIEGEYTPESGRAWYAGAEEQRAGGTADGGANAISLGTSRSGGVNNLYFDVFDATGVSKRKAAPHTFAAGSAHRLGWEVVAGTMRVLADGADLGGSASGAGTGIISTQPAALYIGASNASMQFGGYIQNFRIRRGVCR